MRFFSDCVSWNPSDVHVPGGLCDLIDSRRQVTRRTFLRHVDRGQLADLESALGYDSGFRMASDWHVEYFRSKHHGVRVYGFRWSGIEHVFKGDE